MKRVCLGYEPPGRGYPRHTCMAFVCERSSMLTHCIASQNGATKAVALTKARRQASAWLRIIRRSGVRIP